MGLVLVEKSWFGSSNGELEECPGLCGTWMTDTHLWKGTQHPCSQRKAMVSVEEVQRAFWEGTKVYACWPRCQESREHRGNGWEEGWQREAWIGMGRSTEQYEDEWTEPRGA